MTLATPAIDTADLSRFSPLNQLDPVQLETLLADACIERIPPGRRLFSLGDNDRKSIFLLSGQLALLTPDNTTRMLKAATREATMPIVDQWPRPATALARTSVTILSIESARLSDLLGDDRHRPADTAPPAPALDLGPIFASPLFADLPPPHLQVLMNQMRVIDTRAGEVILREGDESTGFHIIESGRYRVTHRFDRQGRNLIEAELGPFECFGEGALIANKPHDETVTALEDGRLLRFTKGEFLTLILRPRLRWIACRDIDTRKATPPVLLDVRSTKSYHRHHLEGSINLPLRVLRKSAGILDQNRCYIVCCDNVRRSTAAAFLLARHGIDVMILSETIREAQGISDRRGHA